MVVTFHILSASGALTGDVADRLRAVLEVVATDCSSRLILTDVDVVVMQAPGYVIPRIGVNGFAYDAHQVTLQLDVEHAYLKGNFERTVGSVLSHELHHCARALARGSSHSDTYGASLVAEGLACCFEEEVGLPTPFYAVECRGDALRGFAARAREQVGTSRWDLPGNYNDWMFGRGSDDPEFPYQCGYSLGYALVRDWLDREGALASEVAGVDEVEVLREWANGTRDPFGTAS